MMLTSLTALLPTNVLKANRPARSRGCRRPCVARGQSANAVISASRSVTFLRANFWEISGHPSEQTAKGTIGTSSTRRAALLSMTTITLAAAAPAFADEEEELVVYYGAADPPATYGGRGGTTLDKARYSYKYPASWKEDLVNKVEKGTNGTDSRFISGSPRKKAKMYCVSLRNEGGAGGFKLKDLNQTLNALAGSDATFQDALNDGQITSAVSTERYGQPYFDYVIEGPNNFLVSITTRQGRVFGFFISGNTKTFNSERQLFNTLQASFQTYSLEEERCLETVGTTGNCAY